MIMSDGSVESSIGTTGWIITTEHGYYNNSYIWGRGKVPCGECGSHRAECFGILGGVSTWKNIKTFGK
jgi:hypothetical protein